MNVQTIGIDLGKTVFHLVGLDQWEPREALDVPYGAGTQ